MRNIVSKLVSTDATLIQELPTKSLSSLFKNLAQRFVGKVKLNDESIKAELPYSLKPSELISNLDLSELQSQNVCIIGRSGLRKTSLCKLFIDEALLSQRTVYVISGGRNEYNDYQDKIYLQQYWNSMMVCKDYDLYLENYGYKLLQDIEPVNNALIVFDEIDPWTQRLDVIEKFVLKVQSAKAQVICASQNYRLEEEFLKRFSVLLVPKCESMVWARWAHDFFLRMDQISTLEKEVQPFNSSSPLVQIRHLKPE